MLQRDTHRIKKLRTNLGDSVGGAWFNLFNPCKGKFSRYTVSLSFCSYLSLCLSLSLIFLTLYFLLFIVMWGVKSITIECTGHIWLC